MTKLILIIILAGLSVILGIYQLKSLSVSQQKNPDPLLTSRQTKEASSPAQTQPVNPSPTRTAYTPVISGNQLKVPILMYHYVGNNPNPADKPRDFLSVTPEKFDEQMKFLKDNSYQTTTLDTLYAALKKQVTLPDRAVILTFDDGYIDFYYNAYPILLKYGHRATVFIPTALMDQGFYLKWSYIKELYASGLITFGTHSVHHSYLPALPAQTILSELEESKKVLQDTLGVPINFLAYPYGATNGEVIELAKKAGYMGALGTWANKIQSEGTIYNMPRLRISGSMDLPTFISLFGN